MTDEQRKLLAAELLKKEEAQNEEVRQKAEAYKKKHGSFDGLFQPKKEELPNRAQIAKNALKSAMSPEKADENSPLGRLVKSLKKRF